jgi:putative ABC transport system permease protein
MTLPRMAWRYLWTRPLVTLLTLSSIALGVALICAVLTLRRETERTFQREAALFDLVVGAKGSPLQLTLSSVYHLDMPTGNVPWALYEKLKTNRRIETAIPIGLGDNYAGFRIVGTEPHLFELKEGTQSFFQFAQGAVFKEDFEVVLGSQVAQATGLKLGDAFAGTHGLISMPGSEVHGEFPYRVCGILEPTGTAQDRAIFGTLRSVWIIHDKEHKLHAAIQGIASRTESPLEVTAVLIRLKARGLRLWVADDIRNNTEGMPAIPINEILRLYQNVLEPMQKTLLAVAAVVVIVACFTVLVTLYQAAERRRRDIAIIRCLGGRRSEVGALILLEAVMLTLGGVLGGWLLGHGALALAAPMIREQSGLLIQAWGVERVEIMALLTVFSAGAAAGIIPAITSYRRTPTMDLEVTA